MNFFVNLSSEMPNNPGKYAQFKIYVKFLSSIHDSLRYVFELLRISAW